MEYFKITEEGPHVVRVAYAGFDPTEKQFGVYLRAFKELLESRAEPMVLILDYGEARYLSSKLRIRQGNWIKQNVELIQRSCLKWNYVINSPLAKFIVKGIFLVQKPPLECEMYTDGRTASENAMSILSNKATA